MTFVAARPGIEDPRDITAGNRIPDEGYCDQPYVVVTGDGNWLCTLTTGAGREGQRGQHIVATISSDRGKTWSKPVDIEPADGPEASWVVPLITPGGRVYGFYTYNGDNMTGRRADMLGWYCYKYSDDHGRTWSKRTRLPLRLTACDRGNDWKGKVQIFWGIDKPSVLSDGSAMFAFTKLGRYMLENGEGWFFRSDNILKEKDVAKLHWQLLPEGEHGLRAPEFGSVQEEHNFVELSDGSLYCVYRTTTGYPCHAYSRDGGRTWTKPEQMTYTPGGRKIKTPRACPKLWRTAGGRFLFWFHNNSSRSYQARNPVWIAGGIERNGKIHWSQPEILLYDKNLKGRMSYPDLIEQDGRYWVTETQKTVARVHEIDKSLLEGLWKQGQTKEVSQRGLVYELGAADAKLPEQIDITKTGGLSLDCRIKLEDLSPGQVLVDSRDTSGKGFALTTADKGALRFELSDGKTKAAWDSDAGLLQAGKLHHVVAIADAGPRIITFVIDGTLNDGGPQRQFGWGRWKGDLRSVRGAAKLRTAPAVQQLRVYNRYLRTSEAVAHFHAGR